jgi:hypothetical protein
MEMNVERTKVIRFSRHLAPVQIMINQKQLGTMEYCNYVGSLITNDTRCTREIKTRTAMTKSPFKKERALFTRKLGLI